MPGGARLKTSGGHLQPECLWTHGGGLETEKNNHDSYFLGTRPCARTEPSLGKSLTVALFHQGAPEARGASGPAGTGRAGGLNPRLSPPRDPGSPRSTAGRPGRRNSWEAAGTRPSDGGGRRADSRRPQTRPRAEPQDRTPEPDRLRRARRPGPRGPPEPLPEQQGPAERPQEGAAAPRAKPPPRLRGPAAQRRDRLLPWKVGPWSPSTHTPTDGQARPRKPRAGAGLLPPGGPERPSWASQPWEEPPQACAGISAQGERPVSESHGCSPSSLCPPLSLGPPLLLDAPTGDGPHYFSARPPRGIRASQHHCGPFSPLRTRGKGPGLVPDPLLGVKPLLLFPCLFLASVFPSSFFSPSVPATARLFPLPTLGQPAAAWLPPCAAETFPLAQLLSARLPHPAGQERGGLQLCQDAPHPPHRLTGGPSPGRKSPVQAWSWCPKNSGEPVAQIELTTYRMCRENRVSLFCLELIWSLSSEPHPLVSGMGKKN